MKAGADRATDWVYRGIWRVLSDGFRVPEQAPTLPHAEGAFFRSFHPSRRYLDYLKLYFWVGLVIVDAAILVGWTAIFLKNSELAYWLALPALLLALVPDILAYIAIHLRYDTMWYVMTDRSLRCRRGILVILEHTITFENVQNVNVQRGPVQYFFGISTVVVETAGASGGEGENEFAVGNKAILQGIGDPKEIRELIMERVEGSRSAGLGDERPRSDTTGWSAEHLGALREISAQVGALRA